jgi:hypothetical protein
MREIEMTPNIIRRNRAKPARTGRIQKRPGTHRRVERALLERKPPAPKRPRKRTKGKTKRVADRKKPRTTPLKNKMRAKARRERDLRAAKENLKTIAPRATPRRSLARMERVPGKGVEVEAQDRTATRGANKIHPNARRVRVEAVTRRHKMAHLALLNRLPLDRIKNLKGAQTAQAV